MTQQPQDPSFLDYRLKQVEHEVKQKVALRELSFQLSPIQRDMAEMKEEMKQIREDIEKERTTRQQKEKVEQEKKEKQYKLILRAVWVVVAGILSFAGGVALLIIQHWIG
jgi:uncharacterized protein YqhQ